VVCDRKTVRRRRPRALALPASSSSLIYGLARPRRARPCAPDAATTRRLARRNFSAWRAHRARPSLSSTWHGLARPRERAARWLPWRGLSARPGLGRRRGGSPATAACGAARREDGAARREDGAARHCGSPGEASVRGAVAPLAWPKRVRPGLGRRRGGSPATTARGVAWCEDGAAPAPGDLPLATTADGQLGF
jgi:hypothetical protein